MRKALTVYIPALGFLGVLVLVTIFDAPLETFTTYISGANVVSYITYVLMLVAAVVLMPVTVMPLIPLASSIMGPFVTTWLSIVGWTLGGVIAFLIARHVGRPVLERFVSMEAVDALSAKFPKNTRFFIIVLLRTTLPVDLVSYALGFSKHIGLLEYTLATLVGVSWFAFAFAYLGEALLTGNMPLLIEIVGASLFIFVAGWYFLKKSGQKD